MNNLCAVGRDLLYKTYDLSSHMSSQWCISKHLAEPLKAGKVMPKSLGLDPTLMLVQPSTRPSFGMLIQISTNLLT